MISRKIWHGLYHPPRNAKLLLRLSTRKTRPLRTIRLSPLLNILRWLYLGIMPFTSPFFVVVPILVIMVVFVGRFLHNTVLNVMWASEVSMNITREQENHTFSQLAVLPFGAQGVCWRMYTAFIHQNNLLDAHFWLRLRLAAWVGGLSLYGLFLLFFYQESEYLTFNFGLILVVMPALIAIFLIDFYHSTVLAPLISLLIPTYASNTTEARLFAGGIFLLCQVTTYMLTVILAAFLLDFMDNGEDFLLWAADAGRVALVVVVFFAIREGLVMLLWQLVKYRLNTDGWNWT